MSKALLPFLLLSSFLFPMLKWLKLGWMRFHPNGLCFLFFRCQGGGNQKAPAPQVFSWTHDCIVPHAMQSGIHRTTENGFCSFVKEHMLPWVTHRLFEKSHCHPHSCCTCTMASQTAFWAKRDRPVPSPSHTQTSVPAAGLTFGWESEGPAYTTLFKEHINPDCLG